MQSMFTNAHTPFQVKDTLFKISSRNCNMCLLLCCLGALATCGLGFSSKDKTKLLNLDKDIGQGKPLDETFASFKAIFHKKYKDDKEETKRKNIFEENTKLIKDINKKHAEGKLTYYAGVNEFADLTHEEILNHYTGLLQIETMSTRSDSSLFRRRRALPDTMDWRNEGLLTEVKNQGHCGSCWAFSVASTCKYDQSLVKANSTGYVRLTAYDEGALAYAVAQVGPIAVAIDASQRSFDYYRGGVYNEPNCSSDNLDHAVLAVGYGTSNGQNYWLVKNSWGTSWGMDGYIQMSRNLNNQCGIATSGIYPLV